MSRGEAPRRRPDLVTAVLAVVVVLVFAAAMSVVLDRRSTPGPSATPTGTLPSWVSVVSAPVTDHGFTVRLVLASDHVVAGQQLSAALVVDDTGHQRLDFPLIGCDRNTILDAGLASTTASSFVSWGNLLECSGSGSIVPGRNLLPISLNTLYDDGCRLDDAPNNARPGCPSSGVRPGPALPPGRYQTVLAHETLPTEVPLPRAVAVIVLPASTPTPAGVPGLTTRLIVGERTAVAGSAIPVTMALDNATGRTISYLTGCGEGLVVGLNDLAVGEQDPPGDGHYCDGDGTLAPGVTLFHATLTTRYVGCGGPLPDRCLQTSVGPVEPPLPPGTYQTIASFGGLLVPPPAPVTITLTAG